MAEHRRDRKVELHEIDDRLTVRGKHVAYKEGRESEPDTAYDLQLLLNDGLLEAGWLVDVSDASGKPIGNVPIVRMTKEGLATVAETERNPLLKAYDKQPMTAIQVCVMIASFLLSPVAGCVGGWYSGRLAAEAVQSEKAEPESTQPEKTDSPDARQSEKPSKVDG